MWNPFTLKQKEESFLAPVHHGLPKTRYPKKVLIAGAGMAGLVAGQLLKEAGHEVEIIEAADRVGGRVYTIRRPFSDGLYLDVGAMRIPQGHRLTLAYIKKFGLKFNPFYNATPNDLFYINGVLTRRYLYNQDPDILNFPVAQSEKGKNVNVLLMELLDPLIRQMNQSYENWNGALKSYDPYSMIDFLRFNPYGKSLSPGAIDMVQVLYDIEGVSELAFLEFLLNLVLVFLPQTRPFYEISGGNDQLPQAFLPFLKEQLILRQKVVRIEQREEQVAFYTVNKKTGKRTVFTGDFAIVTLPFSVLQFVDIYPCELFSYQKRRAINELHYSQATKIGLEFRSRFWERYGLRGGCSITDLPIRFTYFPSHGIGEPGPAVILASYTWGDDAAVWDCQSSVERVAHALDQLSKIFGRRVYEEFVTGTSHSWSCHSLNGGGFTLFKSGQKTRFGDAIRAPEGRVHFAGEHTSHFQGWIQGAIESGIRAASEVNEQANRIGN
ncbi:flavin monoamine oxidase family protein [Camelliibacillus cellulosilyticus]|uniref:Flavin monoamine oxidase family protein n=1 Tax=Camelliibacillus cellulosilyticus TaxID=2174486 RepID=A0ABV9GN99_9BACL